jgi:siroheme synthase (precorrin-2 oxidase/ferrochelatase)
MASEERTMILTATNPYLPKMMMMAVTTRIGLILGVSTAGLQHQVFLVGAAGLPDLDTEF